MISGATYSAVSQKRPAPLWPCTTPAFARPKSAASTFTHTYTLTTHQWAVFAQVTHTENGIMQTLKCGHVYLVAAYLGECILQNPAKYFLASDLYKLWSCYVNNKAPKWFGRCRRLRRSLPACRSVLNGKTARRHCSSPAQSKWHGARSQTGTRGATSRLRDETHLPAPGALSWYAQPAQNKNMTAWHSVTQSKINTRKNRKFQPPVFVLQYLFCTEPSLQKVCHHPAAISFLCFVTEWKSLAFSNPNVQHSALGMMKCFYCTKKGGF